MEIRLLGPLRVLIEGDEVSIRRRQLRALMVVLSLTPHRAVPVDTLVDALWGTERPADAAHTLHVYISRLRQVHAEIRQTLITRDEAYELAIPPDSVDVIRFEQLVAGARGGGPEAEDSARAALRMWSGQPLLGFQYEEFAQSPLRRLERMRRDAVVAGSRTACGGGDHAADWLIVLEETLESDPFDDEMWQALVACFETLGQTTRAEDARWRRERALEVRSLTGSRIARMEPIVGAGPGLIGRDEELEELATLLSESRLVSIVGPPGSGKTRLALHVAAASELPVRVVAFADHSSAAQALCTGLGIPAIPGAPSVDSLARYTAPDDTLVVLDNCESVADEVAEYVQATGVYSPGLRLLTTSRVPLRVPGESVYPLGGLSTVPEEGDRLSAAAQLLSARLGPTDADESLLTEIGAQLDGIPLAIEVTAASMGQLSAGQILTRIRNPVTLTRARIRGVPDRHSSLGRALSGSFQQLSEPAKLVFRRVGWFVGSFNEDDAAAVAPELEAAGAVAALDELVTSSLLWPTPTGYRMLWVVAAFARALTPEVANEDRRLHAARISEMVTALSPSLFGANASAAHDRLDAIAADIDGALDYAVHEDAVAAIRLTAELGWHWHVRGDWADRLHWAEQVMDVADLVPAEMALEAAFALMMLQFDLRDISAALTTATTIVSESTRLGYPRGKVMGEAMTAAIHSTTGNRAEGLAAAARARRAAEALNEPWLQCVAWFSEASVHLNTTTHDTALELCREIVATPDAEPVLWSSAAYILASAARREGMTDRAEQLIDHAVTRFDKLKEPVFRPLAHLEQAMVYRALDRPLPAARTLLGVLDEAIRSGDWMAGVPCIEGLALVALDLDRQETALTLHASAASRRKSAPWDLNPWELPEATSLDDKLVATLPPLTWQNAIQRGELLNDENLLKVARSVTNPERAASAESGELLG